MFHMLTLMHVPYAYVKRILYVKRWCVCVCVRARVRVGQTSARNLNCSHARTQEESQNQSEEMVRVKAVTAQRACRQRAIEQQLQEVESLNKTTTNKLQVGS